jgi:hypothetical protein
VTATKKISDSALRVAFWGLALHAATLVAAIVLETYAMASSIAQAVMVEAGVGRLGVAWSDPLAPIATTDAIARRASLGAGIGVVVAGIVVLFLAVTHAFHLAGTLVSWPSVALMLVTASFTAMRDELLQRGLVFRMLIGSSRPLVPILASGFVSGAAAVGENGFSLAVATQGLLGVVFGALWHRDRGAWAAWGAHAGWLFATGLLTRGGLFEAHVTDSTWGGGTRGALAGMAAVVALTPLAIGALVGALGERKA